MLFFSLLGITQVFNFIERMDSPSDMFSTQDKTPKTYY